MIIVLVLCCTYSTENLACSQCSITVCWINKGLNTPGCGAVIVGDFIKLEDIKLPLGWVVLRSRLGGNVWGSLIMVIHLSFVFRSYFVRYKVETLSSAWLVSFFLQYDSKLGERTVIYFHFHIPTFILCLKLLILICLIHKVQIY